MPKKKRGSKPKSDNYSRVIVKELGRPAKLPPKLKKSPPPVKK